MPQLMVRSGTLRRIGSLMVSQCEPILACRLLTWPVGWPQLASGYPCTWLNFPRHRFQHTGSVIRGDLAKFDPHNRLGSSSRSAIASWSDPSCCATRPQRPASALRPSRLPLSVVRSMPGPDDRRTGVFEGALSHAVFVTIDRRSTRRQRRRARSQAHCLGHSPSSRYGARSAGRRSGQERAG